VRKEEEKKKREIIEAYTEVALVTALLVLLEIY
jgi:hypothetical protein